MVVNFQGFQMLVDFVKFSYRLSLLYSGKVWRIDSFQVFGERKFGELIDQPIGYQL